MNDLSTLDAVKAYYGQVLQKTQDLKTSACCSADSPPALVREILRDIHDEVKSRFYGCGSPFPPALEGRTVLVTGANTGIGQGIAVSVARAGSVAGSSRRVTS